MSNKLKILSFILSIVAFGIGGYFYFQEEWGMLILSISGSIALAILGITFGVKSERL